MMTQTTGKMTVGEILCELRTAERGRLPVSLKTTKGEIGGIPELLSNKVAPLGVDMKEDPKIVLLTREGDNFSTVALRAIIHVSLESPELIVDEESEESEARW